MTTERLGDHGEFFAAYQGTGSLALSGGGKRRCRFEAGQSADGRCVLLCDFDLPDAEAAAGEMGGEGGDGFTGTTVDGLRLKTMGPMQTISSRHESSKGWTSVVYRLREFEVTAEEGRASQVRFGVTNLGARPWRKVSLRLDLAVPVEIVLVPISGAEPVDDGYRVTCEIEAEVDGEPARKETVSAVSSLCRILSVAQGTMAQWIYLDEIGQDGRRLRRRHSSHYTKPYQSHELVEIEGFVEPAYQGYVANDAKYDLSRMMILSYLDAIAHDDLLERRAVKLAVVVETLKSNFLKSQGSTVGEFIIADQGEWDALSSELKKAVKKVLGDSGISPEKRSLIYSKLGELRRTPFKAILKGMFGELGFRPAPEDLELFVRCRDSLIHAGEFYAASDEEQRQFYKYGVTVEEIRACNSPSRRSIAQYLFIKNFVNRLFLKLLDYDGPYRDHRLDSPVENNW